MRSPGSLLANLALVLVGVACETPSAPPPNVPASLAVPDGAGAMLLRATARGAQVYTCAPAEGDSGASFAWKLTGPEATLYDESGKAIGTHFAGPTWRLADGSSTHGKVIAKESRDAGSIPWLLLGAEEASGDGLLSRARFIQRLETKGGKAPATGCDAESAGKVTRADYTAIYVFWGPG